jgi:hypothetical protein
MRSSINPILVAMAVWILSAVLPAQAVESRVTGFTVICDGSAKNVVFSVDGLGASVNRAVISSQVAITAPRGGLNSLRLQVAGDPKKTLLIMGFNQVSASTLGISYITLTTPGGRVSFQIGAACKGGGALRGIVNIIFN